MIDKNVEVSICIVTRNRDIELIATLKSISQQSYSPLEVIIIDNNSERSIIEDIRQFLSNYSLPHNYILNDKNLGVSGGRNIGLITAVGDYIIEIDDDAVFESIDAIEKAVNFMDDNPFVGISAFRITNFFTNKIVPQEFPFRNKNRDPNENSETCWFIGAGHIFRKDLLDRIGYYHEFYPWGSEEQDLALRALDAGFKIYYLAYINVLHKKSPKARISNRIEFASIALKNRIKVASLNLPLFNVLSYILIRGIQFTIRERSILVFPKAIMKLLGELKYINRNRKVIKKETIKYLKSHNGQLYY